MILRIEASSLSQTPDRTSHRLVSYFNEAHSYLLDTELLGIVSKRLFKVLVYDLLQLLKGLLCALYIKLLIFVWTKDPREELWQQLAYEKVCISDCEHAALLSVANGPRISSTGLWSHFKEPFIKEESRTSASCDGRDVELGSLNRSAGYLSLKDVVKLAIVPRDVC